MSFQRLFTFLIVFIFFIIPVLVFAEPSGNFTGNVAPKCSGSDCSWSDLIEFGKNILNFIIYIAIIAAALMFAYAGFLYMTDGGSSTKIKDAHGIFFNVAVGIIIVLVAWLLVDTLLKTLTGDGIKKWTQPRSSIEKSLHSLG